MMVKGGVVGDMIAQGCVAGGTLWGMDEVGVTEDIIVKEGAMKDMMVKRVSWSTWSSRSSGGGHDIEMGVVVNT